MDQAPQRSPLSEVQRPLLRLVPSVPEHTVITMPNEGVTPILEAITGARRRITVKMFKLTSGVVQQALIEAHRRGVCVRVLLNPRRSDGSRANDEAFEIFQQAGLAVEWTSPDFYVTHEKSMVVDDSAWVCTFNFANKYFKKSRGYAVVTRVPEEVAEVLAGFEADWSRQAFQPGRLVWSQPDGGNSRHHFARVLGQARHELEIQTPKLVDEQTLQLLVLALQRGVRVRFLGSGMKGLSDYDVVENTAAMKTLLEHGAEVHAVYHPRVHAKLVVADTSLALIGSMNLDRSCFELRRELGVVVRSPQAVADLRKTFERDWVLSTPFTP